MALSLLSPRGGDVLVEFHPERTLERRTRGRIRRKHVMKMTQRYRKMGVSVSGIGMAKQASEGDGVVQ